jgi:hypothetical protein
MSGFNTIRDGASTDPLDVRLRNDQGSDDLIRQRHAAMLLAGTPPAMVKSPLA